MQFIDDNRKTSFLGTDHENHLSFACTWPARLLPAVDSISGDDKRHIEIFNVTCTWPCVSDASGSASATVTDRCTFLPTTGSRASVSYPQFECVAIIKTRERRFVENSCRDSQVSATLVLGKRHGTFRLYRCICQDLLSQNIDSFAPRYATEVTWLSALPPEADARTCSPTC
jgi:hypothetical protein